MIEIDKGIPVPTGNARSKYPLGEMDIGDSFFAPGMTSQQITGSLASRRPKKFSIRTVTENGVNGIRVWRVA